MKKKPPPSWRSRLWQRIAEVEGRLSVAAKVAIAIGAVLTLTWTWVVPAIRGGWQGVRTVATKPWVEWRMNRHEGVHDKKLLPVLIEVRDGTLWRMYREINRDQMDVLALEEKQKKKALDDADLKKLVRLRSGLTLSLKKYEDLQKQQEASKEKLMQETPRTEEP